MPLVCYITDRHSSPAPILHQIQLAIEAGIDLIQIREKDLATRELLELAQRARSLAKGAHSRILINDRLDIALVANLDGIHLGQHSVLPQVVRAQVPRKDFLVGASVHSPAEFREVENQGVSFVTLGPIFYTPSKAAYGDPIGVDVLEQVCRKSRVPVLALGGIDLGNYSLCLDRGAAGIAAIRLFQCSGQALKDIVREIQGTPKETKDPALGRKRSKG
jgi:thiamine-phosphate pyrophosphorylase